MSNRLSLYCIILVLFPQVINANTAGPDLADSLSTRLSTPIHTPDTIPMVSENCCDQGRIYFDSCGIATAKNEPLNIYDMQYSRTLSCPNKKRLFQNTIALYVAGIATLGVLELLPENTTAWNKEELRETPFFKRWWMHVKKGAVWDKDNWVFNYVLHPYGGAAYYMSARSQGLNIWQSALYSFGVSTFFWEYGIEAFMEYPSIQDLIITPVVGTLIGEQFYKIKRKIVADDYHLLGSRFLGHVIAFFVDPVNEFMGLFLGNPCKKKSHYSSTNRSSMLTPHSISLNFTF